jgi:hypothetical protein
MEMRGRVAFLQAVGRIMRPWTGKTHGILIDHAAAVYRHGFPDEDTDWTLLGNVDAAFKAKHHEGKTAKVNYCTKCSLMFSTLTCPGCGRMPVKPPRSIFTPPPIRTENDPLYEAERARDREVYSAEEKKKHWMRCLGVAARRNGNFKMASVIYKQKYSEWPPSDFPCMPPFDRRGEKVADVYPGFARKKEAG